ncbi:hypothetical protein VNO77_22460 [Canavalia gladiata]|uniref:Uncharacterized protein n=1 Tax=Canavalia gladiata TaxID=3824 RepID=A0AAN9QAK8_CANGL
MKTGNRMRHQNEPGSHFIMAYRSISLDYSDSTEAWGVLCFLYFFRSSVFANSLEPLLVQFCMGCEREEMSLVKYLTMYAFVFWFFVIHLM